jgi:Terminase-like family.
MDYGATNPTAMILWVWDKHERAFLAVSEFYHDGHGEVQLDDIQRYKALCDLVGDVPVRDIVIDPSAKSFRTMIYNRKRFRPVPADNDVLDGIALTQVALSLKKLRFNMELCPSTVGEFSLYVWDEKSAQQGDDAPVKTNDHGMDAVRYMVQTVMRRRATYFGLSTIGTVDKVRIRGVPES